MPEQVLRAHLIENGSGIHLRRHLKCDAARDVRLDEAGDHVDGRPLGREDEVDADGARHLREAGNRVLDDDDVWKLLERRRFAVRTIRGKRRVLERCAAVRRGAYLPVVATDVAHAQR